MGTEDIMEVFTSENNVPIRLTYRQWAHIVENHDYMSGCMHIVPETVADPDVIVQGKSGEMIALRHYEKTVISEKHAVPVYREVSPEDGFVITAFMTSAPDKIIRKGVVWRK